MVFQDPVDQPAPRCSRIGRQLTEPTSATTWISPQGTAKSQGHRAPGPRSVIPPPAGAMRPLPAPVLRRACASAIAIAIALACAPKCSSPTSPTTALDVTVQAGVLRLLRGLCDDLDLAVLLVTHDLGVMSAIADEVSVMSDGLVVETGPRGQVLTAPESPVHPVPSWTASPERHGSRHRRRPPQIPSAR